MGSGVAVFDYNGDGHQDILFVNSCRWDWDQSSDEPSSCKLYQGERAFHFEDVTQSVGLTDSFYGMGVAVGDYDNDGDSDLYITAVGENRLYKNDNGTFLDVTKEAGVAGEEGLWVRVVGSSILTTMGCLICSSATTSIGAKRTTSARALLSMVKPELTVRLKHLQDRFLCYSTTWVTGSSKMSP